jgi:hypothetical protein
MATLREYDLIAFGLESVRHDRAPLPRKPQRRTIARTSRHEPDIMMNISFPGGVGVDATLGRHTIHTDQPPPIGADEAMSPFDLFLASIGTCMGFYALRFCQERSIPTAGLALTVDPIRDEQSKLIGCRGWGRETVRAQTHPRQWLGVPMVVLPVRANV